MADRTASWPANDTFANLVVDGYVEQLEAWTGGDLHWTYWVVDSLINHKPELAWPILLEVLRRSPEAGIDMFAAGPLEDFLSLHGPLIIDAVEAEANRNPRLREAMGALRQLHMTDDVWQRVQTAAGLAPAERQSSRTGRRELENYADTWLDGPFSAASKDDVRRLADAVRAVKSDGRATWSGPVDLSIEVFTGDDGQPGAAAQRLVELAQALADEGIIASPDLVWTGSVRTRRATTPKIRLMLNRIPRSQILAYDTPLDLEAMRDAPITASLGAEFAPGAAVERGGSTNDD